MRISDWSSDVCSSDLNKLLPTYLASRRGNCVSMPVLHIILAEKLGLNVHLSTAPLHMFVRYTNPQNQRDLSIEPTSGGYPTRDVWSREKQIGRASWRVRVCQYV